MDDRRTDETDESGTRPTFPARDARGGEIILRTRRRRWIFLGGLVAFVLLAILSAYLR